MKIDDLDVPDSAREFLRSFGFKELYPHQAEAVDAGLLGGRSLLMSSPTASGKTLVAMLAMLSHLARGGQKIIYLSPLRALASEKYAEFAALSDVRVSRSGGWQRGKKIRVARSTGEMGGTRYGGSSVSDADIVVATNESMDAAMRRGLGWVEDISLVVADEVHLIGDESRGPTLEMVLTQLKSLPTKPQLVGLSATLTNADEVADWLDCRLVSSSWRPVPLNEGVCGQDGSVVMDDGTTFEVDEGRTGIPVSLGIQSVAQGGQSLIFAATRVNSRSMALKAAPAISKLLAAGDRKRLESISKRMLPRQSATAAGEGQTPTKLAEELAALVRDGVAFHHAGLAERQRSIIEEEFRAGTIKLLASTTTLAAGINLPARRVIVSNISRYDVKSGTTRGISVLEYKQLCGRAGRPQYDEYGEAIIATRGDRDALFGHYVMGTPEPLDSKIINEKAMRTHLLSVVVLNPGIQAADILQFFLRTFGGMQSSETRVGEAVDTALDFLMEASMIVTKGDRYAATSLGKRVSALYIDPLTASYLYTIILAVPEDGEGGHHTLGFLYAITSCDEFYPRQSMRQSDAGRVARLFEEHDSELIGFMPGSESPRGILALHEWIDERSERTIADTLKIESGDMHRMVETASWLSYALREIARHAKRDDLLDEIAVLRLRIRSGIRAELAELAGVRGIGRVRARALYAEGIKGLADIQEASHLRLARMKKIGPAVAMSIKREVEKRAGARRQAGYTA